MKVLVPTVLFLLSVVNAQQKVNGECKDVYRRCQTWVAQCKSANYLDYMRLICPQTCGFCSGNQVGEKQLATQPAIQQQWTGTGTTKNNDQETQTFSETEPKTSTKNKKENSNSAPKAESIGDNNKDSAGDTTAAALAVHRFDEKQTTAGEGGSQRDVENKTISTGPASQNDVTADDVTSKGKTAAILAVQHFEETREPTTQQQSSEASGDISGEKQGTSTEERISQTTQDIAPNKQPESTKDEATQGETKAVQTSSSVQAGESDSSRQISQSVQPKIESKNTGNILTHAVSIHRIEDTRGPSTQHKELEGQQRVTQDEVSSGVSENDNDASGSGDTQSQLTVNKGKLLLQLDSVSVTSGSGANEDVAASGSDQVSADGTAGEDLMKTAAQDVRGDSDALSTLEDYDKNFGFQFRGDPASKEIEADADFLSSGSGSGDFPDATFPKDVIPRDPMYEFPYVDDREDEDFENFEISRRSEIATHKESSSKSEEKSVASSGQNMGASYSKNNVPHAPLFEFPYNHDSNDVSSRNFEISRRSAIATHEDSSSGSGEQINSSSGLSVDDGLKSPKISGDTDKQVDDEMDDVMNSKQESSSDSAIEAAMNSQTTGGQESTGDNMNSDTTTSNGEGDSNDEEMSELNDDHHASGKDSLNNESMVISPVGSGDIVKLNSPKENKSEKPVIETKVVSEVATVEKLNSNPPKESKSKKEVEISTHANEVGSGSGYGDSSGGTENALAKSEIHSGKFGSIEDAIFEVGSPLNVEASGSGSGDSTDHSTKSSREETGSARARLNLMEKLMKARQVKAFRISHPAIQVPGDVTNRGVVPKSDSGKGNKISFILNEDYQQDYSDENSPAYVILAQNVKKEVEEALGSEAYASDISFGAAAKPGKAPRFSRILTTLRLLGDANKIEQFIKKGSINNLVVEKHFFEKQTVI